MRCLKRLAIQDIVNMNKPIVEAIKTAISCYSFIKLASANNNEIQEIIPENYRKQKEKPLIWFIVTAIVVYLTKTEREAFDSFIISTNSLT